MNSTINKTMKTNKTATKLKPGMTLIEITVVILVLLTLIAVLFIGANIYKKGADRAACILNIRNIHQAVRAEQNLTNSKEGDTIPAGKIMGTAESYFENVIECPSATATQTNTYNILGTFPIPGVVAATCTINGSGAGTGDHFPDPATTEGW